MQHTTLGPLLGICKTNTQCGAMKHCPGPTVGPWYDKHPMQCMAEAPLQDLGQAYLPWNAMPSPLRMALVGEAPCAMHCLPPMARPWEGKHPQPHTR